ncbi:efflux RND transporter periplasmic adaptor subunit [Kordiimonas marina]|uniref:efflux RND transporter periplasmic adaptor subunit n=1 Tax=Kordiimonas marina TaxID=2872312 RepID=UPI001FF41D19|nr:efflux RND transporter periplasmic adaptor subunit [Kordiimonas marina]MCJ9429746.1 efflux RND transporter periplasmic adaptor subunit [Kordiimonas marina]
MRVLFLLVGLFAIASPAFAEAISLTPTSITEWKPVYGRVEARYTVPARARIGGVVMKLTVTEGDAVKAGQQIGLVQDQKLAYQTDALDAQIRALESQLKTASADLKRGETLLEKGVVTKQRLDQLRTQVDVLRNQLQSTKSQRSVVEQQSTEGKVLAPLDGKVLTIPVTVGSVIQPGEALAMVGGGGFFLRLAIPERHAEALKQGAPIRITTVDGESEGHLAKIYPEIQNGRVVADVEVKDLDTDFVNARMLVEVPVGKRDALLVPASAVTTRSGLDFVMVKEDGQTVERAVVPGEHIKHDGGDYVEILSGLAAGDTVIVP